MAIIEDIDTLAAGQQIIFAHTANNVSGVLAVACSASDTTISLSPGGGALFPSAPFYCSIEFEVLWCLTKSGDNLIVQRGMDGTTAQTHVVGVTVEMRNNAGLWTDAYNAINSVSTDVGVLQTNITNKTVMPPDTVYLDTTQELTHKTLDLSDSSKQNVIIGDVSPDPRQLVYQNLLNNGGFEEWDYVPSTTIAAGTPTSGLKTAAFSNFWSCSAVNDSSITVAKDNTNIDPGTGTAVDLLVNVTTVQANDSVSVYQIMQAGSDNVGRYDLLKLQGLPLSVSARARMLSGNPQIAFSFSYTDSGGSHSVTGPFTPIANIYSTYIYEGQIAIPAGVANVTSLRLDVLIRGVGQFALDSIMMIIGTVATNYRPRFTSPVVQNNLLTNGGFEIWQRGPGPFTANSSYFADRWQMLIFGSDAMSIVRDTTHKDLGSNACAACTFSLGSGAGSTGFRQVLLLNTDNNPLQGRTISASVRVSTGIANGVRFTLSADGTGSPLSQSIFHPGNGAYVTITCGPIVVPLDATTIVFETYFGVSGVYYIDNTMLVVGSQSFTYVPTHPADDLSRCLRYCEVMGGVASEYVGTGLAFTASNAVIWTPLMQRKAIIPSVTVNGVAGFLVQYGGGGSVAPTGVTSQNIGNKGFLANMTGMTGLSVGQAVLSIFANASSQFLIEANP